MIFSVPSDVMSLECCPRVAETSHGAKLARYDWSDDDLAGVISGLLANDAMAAELAATSAHMKAADGLRKAARLLDELLKADD